MTFFRTYILWIVVLGLTMALSSCRKYEDGPTFSLTSKTERVVNSWTAQSLFRNDIEETSQFLAFTMDFARNGRFTWTSTREGIDPITVGATWELTDLNNQIKLTFDDLDPISGETRLLYMDIRRLTQTELWVTYLFEGDYFDLKLKG